MKNVFIYLIGFPGVGKLTIAKQLVEKTELVLVDNHKINNLLFPLIETDGHSKLPRPFWENVGSIRKIVCKTIDQLAPPDRSFIFTNCLTKKNAHDQEWYENILEISRNRNATFVPIKISCQNEEWNKRITSEDRKKQYKAHKPEVIEQYKYESLINTNHPNTLELDTTHLSAEKSTNNIINHIQKIMS